MIGTVFLIFVLAFLFFVMLVSFLLRRHPAGFGVFMLSGICIAFILIANLDFLLSPKTKKEVFKVVDAETQKPVPNARVVIGWAVHFATVASSPRCYYKVVRTVSDANGEFIVPPALKAVNFGIGGFYKQQFSGIDICIFDYSINYQPAKYTYSESEKNIKLLQIKTADEIIKSVMSTYAFLESTQLNCSTGPVKVNDADISFFKNAYVKLERHFPGKVTDKFEDGYRMSEIYDELDQPEAYIIFKNLLQKHQDKKSDILSARLNRYRKSYIEKGGHK